MSKRSFRPRDTAAAPTEYPTLDTFDRGRRSFLHRFGLGVLGVGLGAGLAACGRRPVGDNPDVGAIGGVAPPPDARVDDKTPAPDTWETGGVAPAPDARIDIGQIDGEAPMPDARVDQQAADAGVPSDDMMLGGVAPAPDARAD